MKVTETTGGLSSDVPAQPSDNSSNVPSKHISEISIQEVKETNGQIKVDPAHGPTDPAVNVTTILECNEAMSIDSLHPFDSDTCERNHSRGDSTPQLPESHDDSSNHRKASTNSVLPAARLSPSLAPTDSYGLA